MPVGHVAEVLPGGTRYDRSTARPDGGSTRTVRPISSARKRDHGERSRYVRVIPGGTNGAYRRLSSGTRAALRWLPGERVRWFRVFASFGRGKDLDQRASQLYGVEKKSLKACWSNCAEEHANCGSHDHTYPPVG